MSNSAAVPAPPTHASPPQLSHRAIMTILVGLLMGMFLAALDQTIVSTSIRTISDDLGGYSLQAWVTTAYLITSTLATPIYGKLSDMHGRKPFYLAAISIFIIGSALCSISTSMYELAAFRALQGLGAGGLMSLALTIVGDIVPPLQRARYQGYFMAVFGTSSVLGPVLGGLLAGADRILFTAGWRWVFLVNVPIGIVALAVVFRFLNYDQIRKDRQRIDWWGVVTLSVGLVPLLIVAEQGRTWGWGSGSAIACYLVGVVGLAVFVWVEKVMGEAAIIPLRIFSSRLFSQGVVVVFFVGALLFAGMSMLPQYYQVLRGSGPTEAGLQMLPMVAGLMVAAMGSGRVISKSGHYKWFPRLGAILLAAGFLALHFVSIDTPLYAVMLLTAVVGLGLGFFMSPVNLAMQNILPPSDMGVATASATFFRQIGGTLGVAVVFSVLFTLVGTNIPNEIRDAAPTAQFQQAVKEAATSHDPEVSAFGKALAKPQGGGTGSLLDDTSTISKLPTAIERPIKTGFANAMDTVFLYVGILAVIVIILVWSWKEVPLRRGPGVKKPDTTALPDEF